MRVVILGNGKWEKTQFLLDEIKKNDLIIACDGAYNKAKKLGITPQLLIGDMDSLKGPLPQNIQVKVYPKDKDQTDGELAFKFALNKKPDSILWYAPFGERWDHTFGNLFVLFRALSKKIPIILIQDCWKIYLVFEFIKIKGNLKDCLSLIPLSAEVKGITTIGLRYLLRNDKLSRNKTKGVSNYMTSSVASVKIKTGALLVLHKNKSKETQVLGRKALTKVNN